MELKDTKTAENLRKALAGESIARNKYTYFAQFARAQGDTDVADAFEQMAKNEMTHAKLWFELLYALSVGNEAGTPRHHRGGFGAAVRSYGGNGYRLGAYGADPPRGG